MHKRNSSLHMWRSSKVPVVPGPSNNNSWGFGLFPLPYPSQTCHSEGDGSLIHASCAFTMHYADRSQGISLFSHHMWPPLVRGYYGHLWPYIHMPFPTIILMWKVLSSQPQLFFGLTWTAMDLWTWRLNFSLDYSLLLSTNCWTIVQPLILLSEYWLCHCY